MKKVFVLAVIAVLLSMGRADAAPNAFKDVYTSTSGDKLKLELRFEKAPKTIINYYERSIQMDVSDGFVSPARRVFDIDKAGIKTISVYQLKPRLLRIRIAPEDGGMKALKEAFSFSANKHGVVMLIGKKSAATVKASEILTPDLVEASKTPAPVEHSDDANSSKEITPEVTTLSPTEAVANGDDFLANIRKNLDDIKKEGTNNPDKTSLTQPTAVLASNNQPQAAPAMAPGLGEAFIKIGSALMVVLALIFAVSFVAKKYLGNVESTLGTKKQLKVLSNHYIGVKKNVTIVEVGGDILVLGVTNTNVGLLAHITDPDKIEQIKMAHRLPDKPMGMLKKFKIFNWVNFRKPAEPVRPMNSQFAKQVASYAETSRPAQEEDAPLTTRREEAIENVQRLLKQKLRNIEGTA
ncbi:MAG: FliO/MopB family protein [Nitrospinae bacterium]|nr:FliO/MopB family protein [Nitrospinota bacterium]